MVGRATLKKSDPSALVIPFGKRRGLTVAELLAQDPDYARWLSSQGWLADRFAELHTALVARGAASEETPEHNAMQVKFLRPEWRLACLIAARPGYVGRTRAELLGWAQAELRDERHQFRQNLDRIRSLEMEVATLENGGPFLRAPGCRFELRGVDVLLFDTSPNCYGVDYSTHSGTGVELKPSLGDEYPAVMRQMHRLGASILVVNALASAVMSAAELRELFAANHVVLILEADVEACLAEARVALLA